MDGVPPFKAPSCYFDFWFFMASPRPSFAARLFFLFGFLHFFSRSDVTFGYNKGLRPLLAFSLKGRDLFINIYKGIEAGAQNDDFEAAVFTL